ncbi:MAG: DUF742 domain-containing protein [Kineosporiaceae bacterium]
MSDHLSRREPEEDFEDASTVRPYTVTGGRTRPSSEALPIEALVRAVGQPTPARSPEERRILELTAGQYLSIAEVSAHLKLPVGVVRVLVGDLADAELVRIDGLTATESAYNPASTLSVLESVLNGISAL